MFDPATARRIYQAGYQVGRDHAEPEGYRRGYGDGHHAGQQAQALTDEQLIEALAWAQHDLRILDDARTAAIRSTIADIEALSARARRQAEAATRPDSRPRRTAA